MDPSWRITVDSGFKIRIRFSVFEIEVNGFYGEECLSTIVIYDGFDESAEELLRQCGTGTCLKKIESVHAVIFNFTG